MRTKFGSAAAVRLLANPIAFRVVSTLAVRGKLTTEEIGAALSDVPVSTLYRHLSRLREASLVSVIEERPARGTVERTYTVVPSSACLEREEIQTASIGQVRATIRNLVANLTANVLSYVDSRAFSKNPRQLRSFLASANLTDEEYENVIRAFVEAISAAKKRSSGGSTKRRSFYVIALPEASPL